MARKPIAMPAGTNLVPSQRSEPSRREAEDGLAPPRSLVQPQRQQRGAGKHGTGGQLRVDRRAIGDEGRAEADHRAAPIAHGSGTTLSASR